VAMTQFKGGFEGDLEGGFEGGGVSLVVTPASPFALSARLRLQVSIDVSRSTSLGVLVFPSNTSDYFLIMRTLRLDTFRSADALRRIGCSIVEDQRGQIMTSLALQSPTTRSSVGVPDHPMRSRSAIIPRQAELGPNSLPDSSCMLQVRGSLATCPLDSPALAKTDSPAWCFA